MRLLVRESTLSCSPFLHYMENCRNPWNAQVFFIIWDRTFRHPGKIASVKAKKNQNGFAQQLFITI